MAIWALLGNKAYKKTKDRKEIVIMSKMAYAKLRARGSPTWNSRNVLRTSLFRHLCTY